MQVQEAPGKEEGEEGESKEAKEAKGTKRGKKSGTEDPAAKSADDGAKKKKKKKRGTKEERKESGGGKGPEVSGEPITSLDSAAHRAAIAARDEAFAKVRDAHVERVQEVKKRLEMILESEERWIQSWSASCEKLRRGV